MKKIAALATALAMLLALTACGKEAPGGTPGPVTPPDVSAGSSKEEPVAPIPDGEPIVAVTHPDFQLTNGFIEPVEQLSEAPEGFIPITTASEFSKLGLNKTASYILMNDIDLSDLYWGPIALFSGTLEGNGYRVIGAGNVLFEHIDGGTIRNLGVESKTLRASHATLVNELTDGVLYNCYSTGAVQCVPNGYGVAGGLVQQAENYTILSCRNDADVSFASPEEDRGFLGGIVAESKGNGTITNCLNTGDITCVSVDPNPYFASGGIVGRMSTKECSTVTYCRNEGNITGRTAAGLVGSLYLITGNSGNIALSCNTGTVSGGAAAYGICGVANDKTDTQCGLYISSCYNAGELPEGGVGIAGSPDTAFTHCSIIGCYSHTNAPIDGGISSFFTNLQNCYFNDVTANATPNGALFASVQALSEEQMRTPDSYKDFDFDIGMGGWQMGSGDYPYPVLSDRNYLGAEVG